MVSRIRYVQILFFLFISTSLWAGPISEYFESEKCRLKETSKSLCLEIPTRLSFQNSKGHKAKIPGPPYNLCVQNSGSWYLNAEIDINGSKQTYRVGCQVIRDLEKAKVVLKSKPGLLKKAINTFEEATDAISRSSWFCTSSSNLSIVEDQFENQQIMFPVKNNAELDKFFGCYKNGCDNNFVRKFHVDKCGLRDVTFHKIDPNHPKKRSMDYYKNNNPERLLNKYRTTFRASLSATSKNVANAMNVGGFNISADEFNAVFSCLIHKESNKWLAADSSTTAAGLGQFTGSGGIDYIAKMHERFANFHESNLANYMKKLENLDEITNPTERRKSEAWLHRKIMLHKLTRMQKAMWDNYKGKVKLPTLAQNNKDYYRNTKNHEVIFLLSAMMILDEFVRLDRESNETNNVYKLIGATGAYNMGSNGFAKYAQTTKSGSNLKNWIKNLKKCGYHQRTQTINHMLSIKRCSDKGTNQPACNNCSGASTMYCSDPGDDKRVYNKSSCSNEEVFRCVREKLGTKGQCHRKYWDLSRPVITVKGKGCK